MGGGATGEPSHSNAVTRGVDPDSCSRFAIAGMTARCWLHARGSRTVGRMGAENRSQDTPRALHKALVVGGGIGGMAAAIGLRRLGIAVDLVEIDPQWRVYGAGITISPSTVRSFAQLGIMDQIRAHGFCGDGIEIYDMAGNYLPSRAKSGPCPSNTREYCGGLEVLPDSLPTVAPP